jgi:ABC-type multidrug transport system, permease component
MSPTLVLLRKNLLMFRRSKAAVIITFLVPIVLVALFGHVFGLYRPEAGPTGIPLAVVNTSNEPAAQRLVDALRAEKTFRLISTAREPDGSERPLTEADARLALENNHYRYALILPPDLLSSSGLGVHLIFLTNPRNEIESQTVSGILQKTIFTQVPQLLGQSLQRGARDSIGELPLASFNRTVAQAIADAFGGDPAAIQRQIESGEFLPAPSSSAATADSSDANASAFMERILNFETEQVAGQDVKNPMAARLVGGYAIMFLLFAVSGSATSFFDEKNTGVFQRLLSSPVRPSHIVWARFLFGVILGLLQIIVLFLAGSLLYDIDIVSHAGGLFAVALSSAAACSAFGLFVVAVAPNADAASPISTLLVLSMSAVGGAWFPVSFMPDYIQSVSRLTLVYWSVEGFTDVLWAGRPLSAVLPHIGILTGIAAVVMAFAIWRLRRNRMFE